VRISTEWVVGETKHAVIEYSKECYSFPGQLVEDFPLDEVIPRCFAGFWARNRHRHFDGGEGRDWWKHSLEIVRKSLRLFAVTLSPN
jgi:hypothetical protein